MPTSYNGNASNATGTQVTITEPVDGDALTAASETIGTKLLADWEQRLLNYLLNVSNLPSGLTSNDALVATGASGHVGGSFTAGSGNVEGLDAQGSGTGSGLVATGGSTGAPGVTALAGSGNTRGAAHVAPQATPSAPTNGDVWVDTSNNSLSARINGFTLALGATPSVTAISSFTNGYSSSGVNAAGYWKDLNGTVHLRGEVTNATAQANPAFTLPAGFRPTRLIHLVAIEAATPTLDWVKIDTSGVVTPIIQNNGGVLSLEGLQFDTF